ncbi:MAG: DUF2934 domain-containing protein [Gemmatimonadota bacterium]
MPAKKRVIAPESVDHPSTRGDTVAPTRSSASRPGAKSSGKNALSAKPSASNTGTHKSGVKQAAAAKAGATANSATPAKGGAKGAAKSATAKTAVAKTGSATPAMPSGAVPKTGVSGGDAPTRTKATPTRAARMEADVSAASIPVTADGGQGPAQSPSNASASSAPRRLTITEATIRQHAYFLSLQRKASGDPVGDWLEAERDLRARGG